MSDEPKGPPSTRPSRRRRRRRPAQGGPGGHAADDSGGQVGRPGGPAEPKGSQEAGPGGETPAPAGKGRSSRRRRRRPPREGQRADSPRADRPVSGDEPQRARQGASGAERADQGSDGLERRGGEGPRDATRTPPAGAAAAQSRKGRRRRRRRPPRPAPDAGEAGSLPASAGRARGTDTDEGRLLEPGERAEDEYAASGAPLAFPDEEDWGLDEEDGGADLPLITAAPAPDPIADADDLALALDLDQPAPPPECKLRNVVSVRFRDSSDVARFEAGDLTLEKGERVVVETDQGLTVGCAACPSQRTLIKGSPPRLIRRVDANDMRQETRNTAREQEAHEFCQQRIRQRKLPMKLIRVEYLHGGNKALFYFAAEHRVDFRDLVKDLAQRFHTRIVMRQVGVRDEARMTGGIGSCGMPLCCAGWLPKFEPVSIRMAKDQNLVLNPQKVSGQCGRLKCCLTYEQAVYQEARRKLPKMGKIVHTPDGDGKVLELDILRGIVRVGLFEGKVQSYPAEQVERVTAEGKAPAKE